MSDAQVAAPERPWVILMVPTPEMGRGIRMASRSRCTLRCIGYRETHASTFSRSRALRFGTEQEARTYLARSIIRMPRFRYYVAQLDPESERIPDPPLIAHDLPFMN